MKIKFEEFLKENFINYNGREADTDFCDDYNDYIDETNEEITIMGMSYLPSKVLGDVDPIAYDCELSNYIDSLTRDGEWVEVDDMYFRKSDYADAESDWEDLEENEEIDEDKENERMRREDNLK